MTREEARAFLKEAAPQGRVVDRLPGNALEVYWRGAYVVVRREKRGLPYRRSTATGVAW